MSKGPWSEATRARRAGLKSTPVVDRLQERIDAFVIKNPHSSGDTLWRMFNDPTVAQADFFSKLRWPPGVARPIEYDQPKAVTPAPKAIPDKSISNSPSTGRDIAHPKFNRPYTPMVADLLARMAKPNNTRPKGPVNNGNLPYANDDGVSDD
jgi:hypothetical protein